jgi:hypothetical protein
MNADSYTCRQARVKILDSSEFMEGTLLCKVDRSGPDILFNFYRDLIFKIVDESGIETHYAFWKLDMMVFL